MGLWGIGFEKGEGLCWFYGFIIGFLYVFYYSLLIFLAMGLHVKYEEFGPFGDFLMVSFVRDRPEMELKFTGLNAAYLSGFQGKLAQIKELESTLNLTEEQKGVTKSLYDEAAVVNGDLNFLNVYLQDAGLSTVGVTKLKTSLHNGNIEGALMEMETVKQHIVAHQVQLEEVGMDTKFPVDLNIRKVSMAAKNAMQNTVMNLRKQLVEDNQEDYDELYAYFANITKKGKVIYKGRVKEDEYTISKIVARMRAPKGKDDEENDEEGTEE